MRREAKRKIVIRAPRKSEGSPKKVCAVHFRIVSLGRGRRVVLPVGDS